MVYQEDQAHHKTVSLTGRFWVVVDIMDTLCSHKLFLLSPTDWYNYPLPFIFPFNCNNYRSRNHYVFKIKNRGFGTGAPGFETISFCGNAAKRCLVEKRNGSQFI